MPPLCALLHLLSTAHAEDASAQAEPAAEPAPERSVDMVLRTEVHTGAMYDGNVYRSEAEDAPTALAWTLSPRLALSTTDADRSWRVARGPSSRSP